MLGIPKWCTKWIFVQTSYVIGQPISHRKTAAVPKEGLGTLSDCSPSPGTRLKFTPSPNVLVLLSRIWNVISATW